MGKLKQADEKLSAVGLTGSALKLIALIAMVMDHIVYIWGSTGSFPIWFRWIGRIAYPIFAFFVVEGFLHTHDLKKYILRLYLISVGMGVVNNALRLFYPRQDGFYPENNVMATFVLLLIVLWCIQRFEKNDRWYLGAGVLALMIGLNVLYELVLSRYVIAQLVVGTVLPLPTTTEGGVIWLGMGIVFYLFRSRKTLRLWMFAAFTLVAYALELYFTQILPNGVTLQAMLVNWANFFRYFYSWMAVLAAPLLAYYNGQRGKSPKNLFYIFYPAHIYLLVALSYFLF